jgi:hypothetical protein
MYGKKENKDKIKGYKSSFCSITFSMSSQLWYKFNIDLVSKFKIFTIKVNINEMNKFTYGDIYKLLKNTSF